MEPPMAAQSDYLTGTITMTNASVDFTGTATGWLLAGFKEGDTIIDITGATEYMGVIATIDANGAGTLTKAWEGPDLTDVAYRMRYQADGQRVTAQARNLIELLGNGNLQAVAGLSGSSNQVLMFTAPGVMTTVPKTDLTSGANYDVQVALLADRAAYDTQLTGYAVLVADVGDGRAAIYSKASDTSGDWTAAAYVTGPVGPAPVFAVTSTTTLAPGAAATFTSTPNGTGDGYDLDVGIPAGRGTTPQGTYSGATAYVLDDAVLDNGSSWRALGATTGNAPPVLPTTSNTWWTLIAAKGTDGAGTGDVVGPASATDGALVAFDTTTGKLVKALTATQATATLNALVGDSGSGGTKGLVPAPSAGDAAASKFLKASGAWEAVVQVPAASAAEVVTGTESAKYVAPATLKRGRGVAKAWANLNGTGTPALRDSLNISSVTDNGTGDFSFNFTAAMASTGYASASSICQSADSAVRAIGPRAGIAGQSTGYLRTQSMYSSPGNPGTVVDYDLNNIEVMGGLA